MSKPGTIDAIELSACEVFCRDGFDGASLREIAHHAGVSLSSIHEYFESKADLYIHVGMRLFERVESQRRRTLERLTSSGEAIDLPKVVHSLVAPVILPGTAQEDPSWTSSKIRTWCDTTTYLARYPEFKDQLRKATEGWVGLIRDCCPGLGYAEAKVAYTIVTAALYTWETTNHYISDTLHVSGTCTVQDECRLLEQFVCAGIRELVSRPG